MGLRYNGSPAQKRIQRMSAICPYCKNEMAELGFVENADGLGVFIAETFRCGECAYQLERNPVYIFGADDDEKSARQVVVTPSDASESR